MPWFYLQWLCNLSNLGDCFVRRENRKWGSFWSWSCYHEARITEYAFESWRNDLVQPITRPLSRWTFAGRRSDLLFIIGKVVIEELQPEYMQYYCWLAQHQHHSYNLFVHAWSAAKVVAIVPRGRFCCWHEHTDVNILHISWNNLPISSSSHEDNSFGSTHHLC